MWTYRTSTNLVQLQADIPVHGTSHPLFAAQVSLGLAANGPAENFDGRWPLAL